MAEENNRKHWARETLTIHVGGLKNPVFGEVSPPIFQTSTFAFASAEVGAARFSGEQPAVQDLQSDLDQALAKI